MQLLPNNVTRKYSTPTPTMIRASAPAEMTITKNNVFDLIENGVPYEARTRKLGCANANGRPPISISRSGSSISNRFQTSPLPYQPIITSIKDEPKDPKEDKEAEKKKFEEQISQRIDTVGKILFPACYLVFNIFYWAKYLGVGDPHEHGQKSS